MKMVLIVFRESLEQEVCGLLNALHVRAFTEITHMGGTGEAGSAFHSFTWPGGNSMIFTALTEDETDRVVEGFKGFRDQRAQQQRGAHLPLRVFVLPCEQAL